MTTVNSNYNISVKDIKPILYKYTQSSEVEWRVFPLKQDKQPLTKHGFKDATQTKTGIDDFIKQFNNPQCWGGWFPGQFIIDVDIKHGQDGYGNLAKLEAKLGQLPKTRCQKSPSGGMHFIMKLPEGYSIPKADPLSSEYPGVDLQARDCYIGLAPFHTSEGQYELIDDSPIAEAPKAWCEFALESKKTKVLSGKQTTAGPIPQGQQQNTLLNWIRSYQTKGSSEEANFNKILIDVKERFIDQDPRNPWTEEIIREKIRYCYTHPLTDTIPYQANSGDSGGNGHKPTTEINKQLNELPEIIINNRQLRDTSEDTLQALYKANIPEVLFIRNASLTKIAIDENNRPFTLEVNESNLRGDMSRSADFIKINEKGNPVSVSPPLDVVRDILSLNNLKFPGLVNVIESPVIRKDGSVLINPGYDRQSGLYFYPNSNKIPAVTDNPTESDIKAAISLVNEIIFDFPFDCQASHDNALACMFTPIINPMIDDTKPGTIIDKPQAGTGASYFCRIVNIIATGNDAPMLSIPDTEEEIRKEITSLMIKGQTLLIIDNVENKLQSASLASLLTTKYWQGRILGQSKEPEWPNNMVILVNGNNIRLGGDLPRRFIWVRMDAKMAKPFQRDKSQFKHPEIIKWTLENRVDILGAILTIARGWVCAGRPQPNNPVSLGGYETYSSIMGSLMHFIGADSFMGNLDRMYDEVDQDTPQWQGFLETWHENINNPVTVNELITSIKANSELKESLPDAVSDTEIRNYPRRLGIALSKKKDMKFPNTLSLKVGGEFRRAIKWQVVSLENEDSHEISLNCESCESSTTLAYTRGNNINPLNINGVEQNTQRLTLDSKKCESSKTSDKSGSILPEVCNHQCNQCDCYQKVDGNYKCTNPEVAL